MTYSPIRQNATEADLAIKSWYPRSMWQKHQLNWRDVAAGQNIRSERWEDQEVCHLSIVLSTLSSPFEVWLALFQLCHLVVISPVKVIAAYRASFLMNQLLITAQQWWTDTSNLKFVIHLCWKLASVTVHTPCQSSFWHVEQKYIFNVYSES